MKQYDEYLAGIGADVYSSLEMTDEQIEADIREAWEECGYDAKTIYDFLITTVDGSAAIHETCGVSDAYYFDDSHQGVYTDEDALIEDVFRDGAAYVAEIGWNNSDAHPQALFYQYLDNAPVFRLKDYLDNNVNGLTDADIEYIVDFVVAEGVEGQQIELVLERAGFEPDAYDGWQRVEE